MAVKANSPRTTFIRNMFFSAMSIAVSVGFMQFVLLPLIAANMPAEEYGFMLTLIAAVDFFAVTFGGTLCNIRLKKKEKYSNQVFGDFNILAIIYSILACGLSLFICRAFGEKSVFSLFLIGIYSLVLFFSTYSTVFFRLKKKFQLELLLSVIMIVGFLIGFLLLKKTGFWQFIYIFGYLLGFGFCGIVYGKIYKEPIKPTVLFHETHKEYLELNASSVLKELVTYADKLILFQFMGGITVAVYNAAAIVGKCVSLITNPINGLLLSHLSNNSKQNNHLLRIGWGLSIIVAFVFYFIFLVISKPLINLLYPQYCNDAMKIIPYTLIAAMINAIVAMINPFILKALSPKKQVHMNLCSLIAYVVSAFVFFKLWSLLGFCFAVILAGLVKLCFLTYYSLNFLKLCEREKD